MWFQCCILSLSSYFFFLDVYGLCAGPSMLLVMVSFFICTFNFKRGKKGYWKITLPFVPPRLESMSGLKWKPQSRSRCSVPVVFLSPDSSLTHSRWNPCCVSASATLSGELFGPCNENKWCCIRSAEGDLQLIYPNLREPFTKTEGTRASTAVTTEYKFPLLKVQHTE